MTSNTNGTPRDAASSADSTTNDNQCRAVFQRVHETPRVTRTCVRERGHDGPCDDNPRSKWRELLASRVLAALPSKDGITRDGHGAPEATIDVAARIVAIVVDVVGAADEVLHGMSEALDTERQRSERLGRAHLEAITYSSELRRELEALRKNHAQLGRDFDERATAHHLTAIELERCRDELQRLKIESTANRSDVHEEN